MIIILLHSLPISPENNKGKSVQCHKCKGKIFDISIICKSLNPTIKIFLLVEGIKHNLLSISI